MELNIDKLNEVNENFLTSFNYADLFITDAINRTMVTLDEIMNNIQDNIINDLSSVPTEMIENYFLELSNAIYFATGEVERLGLYDSLSKISYKTEYNNNYLNPTIDKAKPTVAELTASAENESIYELSLSDLYNKIFKICKAKIDAAQTMVSSLSKILSRRMSEANLSAMQPATSTIDRQVLNESTNIF